jgi:hypothetical protein
MTYWPRQIDELVTTTTDPHKREMLKNMRRHILLELSGRWREVLVPEFTAEVPRYRVITPLGAADLVGLEAVSEFYSDLFDARSGVWTPLEQELTLTDHSVIGEAQFAVFLPGKVLTAQGVTDLADDCDYMITFRQMYVFEFDAEAKLIGERSYDSGGTTIYAVKPEQVVTFDDAAVILKPYLDNPPA